MRIAFTGTHFSGKTTLSQALQKELPNYEFFEEPYWILSELGRTFSHPPTLEDFEEQLECSTNLLREAPSNALFDRCPIDFLGYALAIADEDFEKWEAKIAQVLNFLDLIVFVPIETPDRILLPFSEDKELRFLVDEKLRELLMENSREIVNTKVIEVTGTVQERLKRIEQELL